MKWLRVRDVADELECSDSYAYTLMPSIPGAWKLGTRWKVSREDVIAYREEQQRCRSLRAAKTAPTYTPGSATQSPGARSGSAQRRETEELHKSLLRDESGAPLIR